MKRKSPLARAGFMKRTRLARRTPMRPRKAFDSKLGPSNERLDRLAREIVFRRDGYACVRCGKAATYQIPRNDADGTYKYDVIQWAHVRTRRIHATRWLPDNALTLCGGCHIAWHEPPPGDPDRGIEPFDPIAWFRSIRPGVLEYLDATIKRPTRPTRMAVLDMLLAAMRELA